MERSILCQQLQNLREKIEVQLKRLQELESEFTLKSVELNQLDNQVSCAKNVVEGATKKLEMKQQILEKLQKSVWDERCKFEEKIGIVKVDKHEENNILKSEATDKDLEKEYLRLKEELNALKMYHAYTTKHIEEFKLILEGLKKQKENYVLNKVQLM